jgi:hypothetical protein
VQKRDVIIKIELGVVVGVLVNASDPDHLTFVTTVRGSKSHSHHSTIETKIMINNYCIKSHQKHVGKNPLVQ